MVSGMWLRAYASGHMALGIWLWAYGSRHIPPGIGRQAYGSGCTQETVRVQRLMVHHLYVGDPKVPKPVCAKRLVNGEVHL